MPTLARKKDNLELSNRVGVADSFFSRAKGLLGEETLPSGSALWIKRCTSIHTFFMRFAIDAVFVDRELRVKAIYQDLGPWRITMPAWGADSVFELPAGTLRDKPIRIGDELYVRD